MKFHKDQEQFTRAVYLFLALSATIVFAVVLFNYKVVLGFGGKLLSILGPFIYGAAFAYLLNPILRFLEKKVFPRKWKEKVPAKFVRGICIFFTFAIVIALLGVFVNAVLPELVKSLTGLINNIPSYIDAANDFIEKTFANLIESKTFTQAQLDQVIGKVEEMLSKSLTMLSNALPALIDFTRSFTTGVMNTVIGIIVSIYILMSKEMFFAQGKKVLHAFLSDDAVGKIRQVFKKTDETFGGFITGKILDSAIIGVLCYLGMLILRMPYAVLISVIVGVTNVIPYFGPFIGAIPSILLLLFVDPLKAVWFGIFVLALQQFDGNILGPKILGGTTGLSAFWVIFAILVGGGTMGVLGMFIAVPLFAVIYTFAKGYIETRLQKKGKPTATKDYASKRQKII